MNDATLPKGCFADAFNVKWNSHSTGGAHAGYRSLCSGGNIYGDTMCDDYGTSSSGLCYTLNKESASSCLSGSSEIASYSACAAAQSAVVSQGPMPGWQMRTTSIVNSDLPLGCVWADEASSSTGDNVWFSTDSGSSAKRHALCIEPPYAPVLSSATLGPYAMGAFGSNDCPANSAHMPAATHAAICKAANNQLGFSIVVHKASYSSQPRGCYFQYGGGAGNSMLHNSHATGAARADSQVICTKDYAYGPVDLNECPIAEASETLFVRMLTKAQCATATVALGYETSSVSNVDNATRMKGCYFERDANRNSAAIYSGTVKFNAHASGGVIADGTHHAMCAASGYYVGTAESNECGVNARVAIPSAGACEAMAFAVGLAWDVSASTALDGCHVNIATKTVYFNSDAASSGLASDPDFKTVCTKAYGFGMAGVNKCDGRNVRIASLADCQAAAVVLGLEGTGTDGVVASERNAASHKGCYVTGAAGGFKAHFNVDAVGAAEATMTSLCEEAPDAFVVTVAPYALSDLNSNACPLNSAEIPWDTYKGMCAAAYRTMNNGVWPTTVGAGSDPQIPIGCTSRNGQAWYANYHATGAASLNGQKVCTGGYAYGVAQENKCPQVSSNSVLFVRAFTEALCVSAISSLQLASAIHMTETTISAPKGCYYYSKAAWDSAIVHWNAHASGGTASAANKRYAICVASDYSLGTDGSNACAGSARKIASYIACESVALSVGYTVSTCVILSYSNAYTISLTHFLSACCPDLFACSGAVIRQPSSMVATSRRRRKRCTTTLGMRGPGQEIPTAGRYAQMRTVSAALKSTAARMVILRLYRLPSAKLQLMLLVLREKGRMVSLQARHLAPLTKDVTSTI